MFGKKLIDEEDYRLLQKAKGKENPASLKEVGYESLLDRVNETLSRLTKKLPDAAFHWSFDKYKDFISEPLVRMKYEEYTGPILGDKDGR